ncbi:MAG: AMP-binding protein [Pseudonocardia sp.]|nr:AMP-binding protein [Pseudonocardia sp.]
MTTAQDGGSDALSVVLTRPATSSLNSTAFVTAEGETWSADEFTGLVLAIAEFFAARGLVAGDRLAVLLPKGIPALAALFAGLRTGVAVVPIDVSSPASRMAHLLADCAPGLVVTDDVHREQFAGAVAPHPVSTFGADLPLTAQPARAAGLLAKPHSGEQPAYILYTSGTTGVPKGVVISRAALAAFLEAAIERAGYDDTTVFLSFFPMHFDPVLMEVLAPWGTGGRTVLFTRMTMVNDLVTVLAAHGVTDFSCTPNVVSMLSGRFSSYSAERVPTLRSVWFGGEVPRVHDIRAFQLRSPGVRLFNGYGPTECTVACSLFEVPDLRDDPAPGPLSIGTPMAGTEFALVSPEMTEVADGSAGELLVSGAQVMIGYWGVADAEANGMVRWRGNRWFRTGDLVHRAAGRYHFDGRRSRLIKIRGYRVHPDEVERALESVGSVREAVVVPDPSGTHLVAVVEVDTAQGAPTGSELVACVGALVPSYMVPQRIIVEDRIPRTSGGKIDMAAVTARARTGAA